MIWVLKIALCCVLCVLAPCVSAGAWPRGEGKVFISASGSFTWPEGRALELPDIYGSNFLEYGLIDRVTLGLDLGSADITRADRLKAVGFARYTLTRPDAPNQFAIDAGLGQLNGASVVRLGVSYGRGFQSFGLNSWISIEAHSLYDPKGRAFTSSLDATYGVGLARGKLMAQISGYRSFDHAQSLSITPSYVLDLGKGRHLEIGSRIGLRGVPDPALKIGIWQEF